MSNQMMSQVVKERPEMGSDVAITRTFDAPRELVWKEWTEPERFKRWWGPKDYTSPSAEMDVRVGGNYLASMRSPEGVETWGTGTYTEVREPMRLVMNDYFADAMGNVVPASYYNMPGDFPLELHITVTFEEHEGKTTMTLRHSGIPPEMAKDAEAGWNQSFDKMEQHMHDEIFTQMKTLVLVEPGTQAATIIRVQDAPRDMVFKAQTTPELFEQFWGPERYTTKVERMEIKKGGVWRVLQRDPEGNEFAFNGVYHEVTPERIIDTWEWEGMPGHVLLETIKMEEIDGRTKLTNISVFQTVEDRDGMYRSGMVEGSEATMDRMAKLLRKMKST